MEVQLKFSGIDYETNLSKGISIAIPVTTNGVRCFHAPKAEYLPVVMGDFIGSVKQGAPINFFNVKVNPHGNGTHTECIGHISALQQSVLTQLKEHHFAMQLITLTPVQLPNGDQVITEELLKTISFKNTPALAIRTLPNLKTKLVKDYSGTNPCYLTKEAMKWIVDRGIHHFLLDLPSVDREEDEGMLNSHKLFWSEGRENATITELIFVPDHVNDGLYLLNLQISNLELDASPSNPTIYPLTEANE